jgi:hypothetical protein
MIFIFRKYLMLEDWVSYLMSHQVIHHYYVIEN